MSNGIRSLHDDLRSRGVLKDAQGIHEFEIRQAFAQAEALTLAAEVTGRLVRLAGRGIAGLFGRSSGENGSGLAPTDFAGKARG
ncbi:hypothetical protein [Lutibaculum baratangense]|nr:hypothetical protein [Lutibaculum baratangense]